MDGIKALAFDTGGTILDWHSRIVAAWPRQERGAVLRQTGTPSPTTTGGIHCGGCSARSIQGSRSTGCIV